MEMTYDLGKLEVITYGEDSEWYVKIEYEFGGQWFKGPYDTKEEADLAAAWVETYVSDQIKEACQRLDRDTD